MIFVGSEGGLGSLLIVTLGANGFHAAHVEGVRSKSSATEAGALMWDFAIFVRTVLGFDAGGNVGSCEADMVSLDDELTE